MISDILVVTVSPSTEEEARGMRPAWLDANYPPTMKKFFKNNDVSQFEISASFLMVFQVHFFMYSKVIRKPKSPGGSSNEFEVIIPAKNSKFKFA